MPREESIMDGNRIDAIGIDWLDMEAQEGLAQALRDTTVETGLERGSRQPLARG